MLRQPGVVYTQKLLVFHHTQRPVVTIGSRHIEILVVQIVAQGIDALDQIRIEKKVALVLISPETLNPDTFDVSIAPVVHWRKKSRACFLWKTFEQSLPVYATIKRSYSKFQ